MLPRTIQNSAVSGPQINPPQKLILAREPHLPKYICVKMCNLEREYRDFIKSRKDKIGITAYRCLLL